MYGNILIYRIVNRLSMFIISNIDFSYLIYIYIYFWIIYIYGSTLMCILEFSKGAQLSINYLCLSLITH